MIKFRLYPFFLASILAVALTIFNVNHSLPASQWWQAIAAPLETDINQMVFHYGFLPRVAMSLLVGAGLGMAGLIFQQVLRNPLAEPTTLGIANGAQLGITLATLWGTSVISTQLAAFIGSLVMGALVFGAAWGKRLSPLTLILTGLVFTLYCSSISQLIGLYYHERLQSVLLWGTGSLIQMDWSRVEQLLPAVLICLALTVILLRPLNLLGLDDTVAKNLGLSLSLSRFTALLVAILLSAYLVNAAGIIGFIGLFAPLLAKLLGVRRLFSRVFAAALIGALLLWVSDQSAIWITHQWQEVSTGTITAVIGAPVLLFLLPRLKNSKLETDPVNPRGNVAVNKSIGLGVLLGLVTLMVLFYLSLCLGRNAEGWFWASGDLLSRILPHRLPRVLAALSAGGMLAVAGCLIQRLTGNPVASPEVLGMSSGAALGAVLLLLTIPGDISGWFIPAGCAGALISLVLIMVFSGIKGFSPKRMLLGGMALNTAFSAILMLAMASGDPRITGLLTWFAGSTYSMTYERAWQSAGVAIVLLSLTPLCARWLTLLPLGGTIARSVGVNLPGSRIVLMLLAAALTATSTFIVGPLSFLGLMAPHIARMCGFRHPIPQMAIAAIAGSSLMMFADWAGRMVVFPYQLPAGLLAALFGVPFFIWLLRRR